MLFFLSSCKNIENERLVLRLPIQSPTVIWWPRSLSAMLWKWVDDWRHCWLCPLDSACNYTAASILRSFELECDTQQREFIAVPPWKVSINWKRAGEQERQKGAKKLLVRFPKKKDSNFYLWFSCFLSHFSLLRICIQSIIPMNKHFHTIEFFYPFHWVFHSTFNKIFFLHFSCVFFDKVHKLTFKLK